MQKCVKLFPTFFVSVLKGVGEELRHLKVSVTKLFLVSVSVTKLFLVPPNFSVTKLFLVSVSVTKLFLVPPNFF
jgi:hypothetical protein